MKPQLSKSSVPHIAKSRVLVVDDEPAIAEGLRELLLAWGYEARAESDGQAALARIENFLPSVVLSDVRMPHLDGFGLLRELRARHPEIAVILLTGQGSVEMAVNAIQDEGAYHYFEKPLDDFQKLRVVVERAVEFAHARRENENLRRQLRDKGAFGELIGTSPAMIEVFTLIEQVAPSSASVLITGESGTGKELVARTIHNLSPRAANQFVAINCSAIPETLMESELFGHEKGAFTGAAARRLGCFELADSGTLLLDEIAEMPALLQAKLLRVLEERRVRRLGSARETPLDVRVLAATNKNPIEVARRGEFREDLLYRLNVITIELPALRQRRSDIPLLAQHLLEGLAAKHDRPARLFSSAALEMLQANNWTGNVRELRNVVERAVIICSGEQIERAHLAMLPIDQRARERTDDTVNIPIGTPIEEAERQLIIRTLAKYANNKTRSAEVLQISLKTLHNKLRVYRQHGLLPSSLMPREMPDANEFQP